MYLYIRRKSPPLFLRQTCQCIPRKKPQLYQHLEKRNTVRPDTADERCNDNWLAPRKILLLLQRDTALASQGNEYCCGGWCEYRTTSSRLGQATRTSNNSKVTDSTSLDVDYRTDTFAQRGSETNSRRQGCRVPRPLIKNGHAWEGVDAVDGLPTASLSDGECVDFDCCLPIASLSDGEWVDFDCCFSYGNLNCFRAHYFWGEENLPGSGTAHQSTKRKTQH